MASLWGKVNIVAIEHEMPAYEQEYLSFHQHRFEYLWRLLDAYNRDSAILDVGCGAGHFLVGAREMGFRDLHGVDNIGTDSLIAKRAARLGIKYKAADLKDGGLPLPEGQFDLVLMSEVLEHFDFFPGPVFKELNRALKPGGGACHHHSKPDAAQQSC